jgi:hypothetical protein
VTGELDGTKFSDPVSLGQALRTHARVPACLTQRAAEYSVRRSLTKDEAAWTTDLTARFAKNGYKLRALLRDIATSPQFFRTASSPAATAKAAPAAKTAAAPNEVTK